MKATQNIYGIEDQFCLNTTEITNKDLLLHNYSTGIY